MCLGVLSCCLHVAGEVRAGDEERVTTGGVLSAAQLTTGSACRFMPAANASDPAPLKSTVAAARPPTTLMTCSRTWHRAPSCRAALTAVQSVRFCDLCDHELLQTWLVRDSSAWCILFEAVKMSCAYRALQRVNVLIVAPRSCSIHDTSNSTNVRVHRVESSCR